MLISIWWGFQEYVPSCIFSEKFQKMGKNALFLNKNEKISFVINLSDVFWLVLLLRNELVCAWRNLSIVSCDMWLVTCSSRIGRIRAKVNTLNVFA